MTDATITDTRQTTSLTLDDYADEPRWVAWRQEWHDNANGERTKTKIPYDPNNNRKAQIPTNPDTWGTRREAEHRWPTLRAHAVDGVGGVGIVLGASISMAASATTRSPIGGLRFSNGLPVTPKSRHPGKASKSFSSSDRKISRQ